MTYVCKIYFFIAFLYNLIIFNYTLIVLKRFVMKKSKRKSKNKTNTTTNNTTPNDNNVVNGNRKTMPGYRLLSAIGGAIALAGGYLWKQSGKTNTAASVKTTKDPCSKYKIGDLYDARISNKTDVDFYDNNPTKILRKGCTYRGAIINDDLTAHPDTTLIDLNFDIHPMTRQQPPETNNFQGMEGDRYSQCSNDHITDYKLSKNDVDKSSVKIKSGIVNGERKYYPCYTLSNTDKKRIISAINKDIDRAIECTKNNPSIKTIAIKYVNHRSAGGDYEINLTPGNFKDKFAEIMKLNKNIYISEFSCYYSDHFPAMISELLKENPNYKANIILKRNRLYDKNVQGYKESMELYYPNGKRTFGFNELLVEPEYLVFNNQEKKCITENEARKILGGSYLYNLVYNKSNKLGDEEPTQKCKASLEKYQQCDNKFNTYQTCDPLLDDVTLNKEKLNQLSHGDNFLSEVE